MVLGVFYTHSRRGQPVIQVAGYRYYLVVRDSKGIKKRWNCAMWTKTKCRATVVTIDGVIIKTVNKHNHPTPSPYTFCS